MLTVAAFALALGLLIAVHEYGHYRVAVACGIKVLKFSIGFGPKVISRISKRSGTEYQIGLLPLGGFVRMLDEREEPVPATELAFSSYTTACTASPIMFWAAPIAPAFFAAATSWRMLSVAKPAF